MTQIKTTIDPNPHTGLAQELEIVQIAYIDFDIKEAKVKFRVYALDSKGIRIQSTSTTYEVWEHFSNNNILTNQGRTINDTNFPIQEGEEQEEYTNRLQGMKDKGIPEFDFWISPLVPILTQALEQGKHLLNVEQ